MAGTGIVQHNITAMSSYRNYNTNYKALAKNLEKLSSGYKINRAGDDAAGLAISEKMRAQISGLTAASKNAKDGISLVQTAEGALTEVHDMLNRMVTLATQSANGTYDNTTDRAQLQKELEQLRDEIDRIADSANFNGIALLDGSMSSVGTLSKPENVTVEHVADGEQNGSTGTQKGEYTFDLGQLKIAASADDSIEIKIGGTTLLSAGDGKLGANDIDDDGYVKMDVIFSALDALDTVKIGGLDFEVSVDSKGVVTLKGQKNPTQGEADTFNQTALDVEVKLTGADGNNGYDLAVHVKEAVQFAAPSKLAQGYFDLKELDIVDGAQLIIGDEVYTFKVGSNGVGSGGTVIDLTAYEAGDAKLAIEAAKILSRQTNTYFDITTDDKGVVALTEKEGRVNYKDNWDLQGGPNTTTDDDGNPTDADPDAPWANKTTGESAVRFATPGAAKGSSLTLQIGDTAKSYNQLRVNIKDMHAASLSLDGINIATQEGATAAIDVIKNAINQVSDVRGTLGATQNRLDHTINNLSVMVENIQDAESTIRDTDIAEEMMAYTKNNILVQSAQAMLAQANMLPQGVLQLLG